MFNKNSTIQEIKENFYIKKIAPYLIYNLESDGAGNFVDNTRTLLDIQKTNITWSAEDMAYGLNRLVEIAKSGVEILHSVYVKEEVEKDNSLQDVKLIFFPAKETNENIIYNPFVILAAGGGYGAVCSMTEAFPVAARLNELGISVFCLNYRVGGEAPLFPKPMEDLAAAVKMLLHNQTKFSIDKMHYAVGGFSAGGHLAATWGLKDFGYLKFGIQKPELILLDYPLLSVWRTLSTLTEPLRSIMLGTYLGQGFSEELCHKYNIDEMMDETYPPVYMIHAENDTTVPIWNSREFEDELQKFQIPVQYEHPKSGGHGFGLGSETEAKGWVERANIFWEELKKEK